MSSETGLSIPSPSSSQPSPVGRYLQAHTEDDALRKDKAYRRYASGIERVLSVFDSTLQEWADYIAFLGRLLKAIQAHPSNITAIPYKALIANRLSQCLNPALPSGVHQKALEVYAYIFELVGTDALSRDLAIYLPGLSSTLTFASLSVRPAFLALLENHLVRLKPSALRPALRAIILALLPGLEEDTSEDFDRILQLFSTIQKVINLPSFDRQPEDASPGDAYFWQCFFLATITSSSRRQGALAFLTRKLPKLQNDAAYKIEPIVFVTSGEISNDGLPASVETIVSPEPGLLVRCFASGLSDDQILIQRGYLDLLVTHLPLHSIVLQNRVSKDDLETLVMAAVRVVARRDMSLNRRLWTWLLGPESHPSEADTAPTSPIIPSTTVPTSPGVSKSPRTGYLEKYGLEALVNGIRKSIDRPTLTSTERARPFRVCLSLMDRWEVGGLVIPDIFLPALDSVRRYESLAPSKDQFDDVVRSASVFFDGVESGLIWTELMALIRSALQGEDVDDVESRLDKLDLVRFIITHFNVSEEEMVGVHVPLVTLALLLLLRQIQNLSSDSTRDRAASHPTVTALALSIAETLIEMIPERNFSVRTKPGDEQELVGRSSSDTLTRIVKFYVQDLGNLDLSGPPISVYGTAQLLVAQCTELVISFLENPLRKSGFEAWSRPLLLVLTSSPEMEQEQITALSSTILRAVTSDELPKRSFLTFATMVSIITLLPSTRKEHDECALTIEQLRELIAPLVREAWSHLSVTRPQYHVEAARCLWQLQASMPPDDHSIEAAICSLLVNHDVRGMLSSYSAEPARQFATLWTHTMSVPNLHPDSFDGTQPPNDSVKGPVGPTYEIMLSRPLFLLLDSLESETSERFMYVRSWLQALSNPDRLFHLLAQKLLSSEGIDPLETINEQDDKSTTEAEERAKPDLDSYLYYLQTLSNVLRWSSDRIWSILAAEATHVGGTGVELLLSSTFEHGLSLQSFFVQACIRVIRYDHSSSSFGKIENTSRVRRVALTVLQQILTSPSAGPLSDLKLEQILLDSLSKSLHHVDTFSQVALLDTIIAALKLNDQESMSPQEHRRTVSKETIKTPHLSFSADRNEGDQANPRGLKTPPPQLLECLQQGFCSVVVRPVLDSWVNFLTDCLPLYSETIFQILLPFVETLCSQIAQIVEGLRTSFEVDEPEEGFAPEATLIALFNALEQLLARAHDRLMTDEKMRSVNVKPPEQAQGFFGNMVSGVFASETTPGRRATANDRLTVLLSFKDAVRICFTVWSWGGHGPVDTDRRMSSSASFKYTSLRVRNRARRLLEQLSGAETLECLETIVEIWRQAIGGHEQWRSSSVFAMLHVLDGSRPKITIPAIFNAIYSRTNPAALDARSQSTLTSEIADHSIVAFLIGYARSLDDDAMDEIWTDCMAFLRDVLTNPFPHRQILPALLDFTAILGVKADNTTFGEQRRMRKDLSDVFMRLLTATFTTKPIVFTQERSQSRASERADSPARREESSSMRVVPRSDDVVNMLGSIVPMLPKILVDSDRVSGAASLISTSVIGPMFRSKAFPENITPSVLTLLLELTRVANARKAWRKDINDGFTDPNFFATPLSLVRSHWLPLLRQWTLGDKERIPEILGRISAPTTAGIMFGVGAASARMEADRKTQLHLRRIATLIIAAAEDAFVVNIAATQETIVELLTATAASSPSSATRAEVYMLLRALLLKVSPVHLAPFWPIINSDLQSALSSLLPSRPNTEAAPTSYEHPAVLLQACKLLDTLIVLAPDDFQLHEWLYITDTIDAVYRPPSNYTPTALVDELAHSLSVNGPATPPHPPLHTTTTASSEPNRRRPLLQPTHVVGPLSKPDLLTNILQPFFSQLSIYAFESTYSMAVPDRAACIESLLVDLFDEDTVVTP